MANPSGGLKKVVETMINSLKQIEKKVNTTEVEKVKELLYKCDIVLKDNIDEKELILKYETFYERLNKFVIKKRKEIVDVEEIINALFGIENVGNFSSIVNKKKENTNQIIDCNNRIVERIRQLETTIYNNRMNELDNMKTQKYDELKQVKKQPIKVDVSEINIMNYLMNILNLWSNKNTSNIIFDSDIDGDGWNNVLHNKVFNKSNLYFITFDENNNVFGGYVSVKINKAGDYIADDNAFVFSLIRNGKEKISKYRIKSDYNSNSAFVFWNSKLGYLYRFGLDIAVKRIGDNESYCAYGYFNYNYELNPFIDTSHSKNFQAKRIIVIEMN